MHASTRQKRLTSVVAIRLSPEQAARLAERAKTAGLTSSEWGRQMLLQAIDASLDTRLILSETLAIRKVVLALHAELLQGHILTEQRVRSIVEQAESTKFAMADSRIHAFRSQPPNE